MCVCFAGWTWMADFQTNAPGYDCDINIAAILALSSILLAISAIQMCISVQLLYSTPMTATGFEDPATRGLVFYGLAAVSFALEAIGKIIDPVNSVVGAHSLIQTIAVTMSFPVRQAGSQTRLAGRDVCESIGVEFLYLKKNK
jgi:hypothetical protein